MAYGSSPSITFSDGTTQSTAFTTSPTLVNLAYTGTLTGGTGVVNLGSGQFYKDASGNVGIGTSSPNLTTSNRALTINASMDAGLSALELASGGALNCFLQTNNAGTYFGSGTATPLQFYTNSAERMRIDSSGAILFNSTSTSAIAGAGTKVLDSGQAIYTVAPYTADSSSNWVMYSTGAAAFRFYVGFGGTISATSTTITGISDVRLKENIVDLDDGLDAVMSLKPRKFDWKEGKGKDIKGDRGFIAQEFETVFPDMIQEWKDKPPEGEEPYKAVNANLIPTLVKAIQEQQAMINELKAKVAALEAA